MTVIASKLRGLVAEDGITLTNAFGCYRLDLPEGTWVDLFAAASGAQDAEEALAAGELDQARAAAESAELLARRPFLSGEDGAWVEQKRRDLADIRERALSVLTDACLRSGAAREAARWAEELIALSPFREAGYRRLMEARIGGGQSGRGAARVRAVPAAARGGARRVSVAGDRLDLPCTPRDTADVRSNDAGRRADSRTR